MKIAWVHKLLGKHSRKFYGILAGILTAAVAGSGVGYHVIAASGTADQTEEDTQIDETDGQEDGSFSGTGTTQVKTESQLPDFSVNAVTMMVEEVYVEAGSTVAEGDALFKIDDESMADAKAYYEDAISDAETALQSAKIDFESGVLEAESELSSTKLAADTAQDTYDAAVSELSVKASEAQEAYDEAVEEISDYQDAIDNGTYYTQVGINEKQSAVDAAQAALTEKQTQLSDAQSSSQAAKNAYAADMANMKTQIEAGASYTDLAALADQLAADYTAVQEAADALSQSQTEAESANSALQLANQTFQKAVEEYNTKVTEANEKIAELTDELEELSDACDEAERNETTAQPALLQQYEEAVLEGKYADTEYEASLETLQSAVDEAQDTLDELKEDIRKHKQEQTDKEDELDLENALVDQVVDGMKVEIPACMIDNRVDEMVRDFEYRLQQQGLKLELYLQYTNNTMEKFREGFREQAEKQVKIRLALGKIVELEKIEASDEELDAEIKRLAGMYQMEEDKIRAVIPVEEVKKDLAVNKAIDLIKSSAVVTEEAAVEETAEEKKD